MTTASAGTAAPGWVPLLSLTQIGQSDSEGGKWFAELLDGVEALQAAVPSHNFPAKQQKKKDGDPPPFAAMWIVPDTSPAALAEVSLPTDDWGAPNDRMAPQDPPANYGRSRECPASLPAFAFLGTPAEVPAAGTCPTVPGGGRAADRRLLTPPPDLPTFGCAGAPGVITSAEAVPTTGDEPPVSAWKTGTTAPQIGRFVERPDPSSDLVPVETDPSDSPRQTLQANSSPAAGLGKVAGDLTFAARVQTAAPSDGNALNMRHPMPADQAAPSVAPKKIAYEDVKEIHTSGPMFPAQSTVSTSDRRLEPGTASEAQPPSASAREAEPQSPSLGQPKFVAPLKDISLQVAQSGHEKVEVRVLQQGAELRVAVRTGDSGLAHGLRQGLADLVGRLEEQGYRAEAWRPANPATLASPTIEAQSTTGSSRNGDSQSQPDWSRQGGGQHQNQSDRPLWVEELESSIAAGGKYSGDSDVITS